MIPEIRISIVETARLDGIESQLKQLNEKVGRLLDLSREDAQVKGMISEVADAAQHLPPTER